MHSHFSMIIPSFHFTTLHILATVHFTSLHFTSLHFWMIFTTPSLRLMITFLTRFLKLLDLQERVPKASANRWFQSWIVLFTK
jgi:hypothetical protein